MKNSRVLLVEDDPSVARFVTLALEELPIDLIVAPDVSTAVEQLALASCALIITDLMLPGESGLGLLSRLRDNPSLQAGALVMVVSAGLSEAKLKELADYSVWRTLSKPVSLGDLIGCVQEALQRAALSQGPEQQRSRIASEPDEAIQLYFSGDVALFQAYLKTCLEQFATDMATGDASVQAGDVAALGRLGHSLKTVLLTLGRPEGGQLGAELERLATAGDLLTAAETWRRLRTYLV